MKLLSGCELFIYNKLLRYVLHFILNIIKIYAKPCKNQDFYDFVIEVSIELVPLKKSVAKSDILGI